MQKSKFGRLKPSRCYIDALLIFFSATVIAAQSLDEDLSGFDDTPAGTIETKHGDDLMEGFDETSKTPTETPSDSVQTEGDNHNSFLIKGLTGKISEQIAYSYYGTQPHDKFTSLKSSLFLDYEHKFDSGWKFKTNAKAYYDAIYDLRDAHYTRAEQDAFRSEVELYDAYIEGSMTDTMDFKLGRQVVVWGRSDTIRITDVLNPLDNRRPGMVDIEDLRLPVTMAKFDYFINDWRITPIVICEQRFSKKPPFGSPFYPLPLPAPSDKKYSDLTYALSVGTEFSGGDINLYAAHIHNDTGYLPEVPDPKIQHDKINMFGTAFNLLSGSWLFKTELAYFDGLKYSSVQDREFSRTDVLLGLEYKGFADTMISYDFSLRHLNQFDKRLMNGFDFLQRDTYQHALRISSDFMNATLHANYLISLFGSRLDEGGFQRAWIKYDIADAVSMNMGVVDYIGGSRFFDIFKDKDMLFMDISYSF